MSHYALIVGSNGYKYSLATNCELSKQIKECHEESHTISSIAIGPDGYFAIICDEESVFYGPEDFMSKMQEINSDRIKHVSFGCDDQWVITCKNGSCNWSLLEDGDCIKAVEENNGNITYVSLSEYENAWIVGYNENDFKVGDMISKNITSFLSGIKISHKKIKLVEIGGTEHYFIKHENGFRWCLPSVLSAWYKKAESPFTSVSLYNKKNGECTNMETFEEKLDICISEKTKLKNENEKMNKKNEKLQKEINKLKGIDVKVTNLNDLFALKQIISNTMNRIEKEIEKKSKNKVLCITCLDKGQEMMFEPCHHLLMCQECANKLPNNKCPVCQTKIRNKIMVFRT
eukprot:169797_1